MRPLSSLVPGEWKERITRVMQAVLLAVLLFGAWTGSPKTVSNSGVGLLVTFLPAVLERNYRVPLDPLLSSWVAAAVFFHALGSAGLYGTFGWWDHLTHALSASLVAAVGYIAVRAIDVHHDRIRLPKRFFFVFVVLFVLAVGVLWELFEYGLDLLSAATGIAVPLSQLGLDDTIKDLSFNAAGAILVAVWGQAYLYAVGEQMADRAGPSE